MFSEYSVSVFSNNQLVEIHPFMTQIQIFEIVIAHFSPYFHFQQKLQRSGGGNKVF